jgi:adenosine 3'-phospho 5'-phosphosulfate transporter B3
MGKANDSNHGSYLMQQHHASEDSNTNTTTTTSSSSSTSAAADGFSQQLSWRRQMTNFASHQWDRLPDGWQFAIMVAAVFLFFGSHNLLQEAMMKILERHHGVMLGYLEVLGVTLFTALESLLLLDPVDRHRKAPLTAYPILMLCLLSSSALSNWSLNYINFPTKVVFRSSKLIPTMVLATILHKQIFSLTEYACATAICVGLIMFAAADWRTTPSFHPVGLLLVTLSVVADAVLPNAQQAVFGMYQATRLEVTLYTNILTLLAYTVTLMLSGEAWAIWELATDPPDNEKGWLLPYYIILYTIISYLAITAHMTIVKKYGGVAAIVVATARKGLTLVLSFLLFPKAFSWYYPAGAVLVLGGLGTASLYKQKLKGQATKASVSPHASTQKIMTKSSDVEFQNLLSDQSASSRTSRAGDDKIDKNSNHGVNLR